MLLLYYYVPESHLNKVNAALFDIGLGSFQNYDMCAWVTKGRGQFRPLIGSKPFFGNTNELEYVDEYKVEMICSDELKNQAVKTLQSAHPYETPAYGFLEISE
jgi:hypothetical protein